jgi:hypothetical protein
VVERVLFGQNAGSVLLRVKRPPFDEAGHVALRSFSHVALHDDQEAKDQATVKNVEW